MSYFPFPFYHDDVPVDISFVFEKEKPAGKHGFLKCVGEKFAFEDETEIRFWGTNFNGGANFPDHTYSETVSKRLSKIGINLVRLHQLDAEWDTPNIFKFTKGPRCSDTRHLDPESMDRLDYLVYCLKNNGIYVYIDIFTYRKFKSGDGVDNVEQLADAAKPYSGFNRRLIDLQKELAFELWNHYNPYTRKCYKDDPVFVLCEIVNESDFFSRKIEIEPYMSEFRSLYGRWLNEHRLNDDSLTCDLNDNNNGNLVDFKIEITESYYRELYDYMRSIGVKIPITGTNWSSNAAVVRSNSKMDFMDNHYYYYDWHWGEKVKQCMNRTLSESEDTGMSMLASMRLSGKPFYVSEWDMPWPNEFRAESPVLYAAIGAFQGWMGFAIHTYAYGTRLENMKMLGKEGSSNAIGGTPYREGIFTTWNDPAKFGLFYHAALITRRGDIKAGTDPVNISINHKNSIEFSKWNALPEKKRFSLVLDGEGKEETFENSDIIKSDSGELLRDKVRGYGVIDSKLTKCVYGHLDKAEEIHLDNVTIRCKNDFAVIAMSSLTDSPIDESDNILLTTVGRARNRGAKFDGDVMLEYGSSPVEIEAIVAEIVIDTKISGQKVWAVNAEGFYTGQVPTYTDEMGFHIQLGETMLSMYYLIQKE